MSFSAVIHKWVLVVLVLSGPTSAPAIVQIPYMGTEAQCEEQGNAIAAKWKSEAPVRVFTYCAQTWYRP